MKINLCFCKVKISVKMTSFRPRLIDSFRRRDSEFTFSGSDLKLDAQFLKGDFLWWTSFLCLFFYLKIIPVIETISPTKTGSCEFLTNHRRSLIAEDSIKFEPLNPKVSNFITNLVSQAQVSGVNDKNSVQKVVIRTSTGRRLSIKKAGEKSTSSFTTSFTSNLAQPIIDKVSGMAVMETFTPAYRQQLFSAVKDKFMSFTSTMESFNLPSSSRCSRTTEVLEQRPKSKMGH